ncbi:Protein CBG08981 [Caenorhabditis briggsae]|uniref:Protein CBG08981 n=1 Tax=Caenorhabditis briggsae TaxID=6238 RepID=A8X833_CAEBR|nr:Protein CBG08981 [Caenorhabditis briggsae]CAP28794.2 Protein CBG08981 [Caenorhabditis briggsae]
MNLQKKAAKKIEGKSQKSWLGYCSWLGNILQTLQNHQKLEPQSIYSFCSRNSVLTPIIENSASLARISAAISIHNGIYSEKSIVQEVTAEFLNISPSVAKELLEHDYGSLSDNVEKFYGSLSKIAVRVKDRIGLIRAIKKLLDMKTDQKYLKRGAIKDLTAHFENTTRIIEESKKSSERILGVSDLKTTVELLLKIRNNEGKDMKKKKKDREQVLTDLWRNLKRVQTQINEVVDYKKKLEGFLSLTSPAKDLQDIWNASKVADKYSKTFAKLEPFRNELASKDTNEIKEAINQLLKCSEPIQHLIQTSTLLNSTDLKYDGKVITRGLLGYKDLNNIWSDFENQWFRQNVLSDLDPTSLKKGLVSLKPFLSSLDSLIPLKQLDNENEKKTILALAKKINKVHQIGSKVKNITNVTTPFEEISTCIKPLQAIQTPPDQAMLKEVANFSGEVVKNVKTFSQLMNGLIKKDLKSISETIRTTIEFLKTTQNDSLEMWDNARKLEKENNLGEKLQKIVKQFDDVLKKDLFLAKPKIGFNVIKTVSKVFGGTNVDSSLNCIQNKSVNNLKEMFGFLDQSDSLMNQKIEFTNATDFISKLLKIRKSFQEVIKKVKNATVPKESQKLMDSNHFKEVGIHSKVIGGSVAALRAIESVLKAEKSIKSVIDMDTDAKREKSTDALINEMKQAETSIGEILKVMKTNNIRSISQIQSILISLSQLKNQTDIKDDNIPKLANKLSNHKDLKLKSLAKDLLAISRLDMRFKNHLKAFEVKNSLETTKQMLVNFLKSYTDDAERRRTMENSSDVGEEQMNFWEWLNTDEAEELIWNISWYFTVGWVTFWILFAISETICNIMYKRDFFFLKSPDHPDKQKERIGSAKQAEEKKAWKKDEEKKKNKKKKKGKNEKQMENPKKVKKMDKWFK